MSIVQSGVKRGFAVVRGKLSLTFVCLALLAVAAYAAGEHGEENDLTERMTAFVTQLGVILFAARIGHILFERIKMPGVLGEFAAGIIIGPTLLGSIPLAGLGFPTGLFGNGGGFPVSPELYGLCTIAAVLLLFTVGLETDMRLLMRYSVAGTVVGVGGVVFSFISCNLVTMFFSRMLFGKELGFFAPECMFLGLIATATSVGISARILSEKRKLDSPEGVTILAGAVIDDVLGVILLAVILGIISASQSTGSVNWTEIGIIGGKAVGVWLGATVVGILAARRISFLLKAFRDRLSIALMGFGLALILAGFFEHAGLATIVGAYVMGLSLSQTDIANVLRQRLHAIYGFLVPVFFCVMGMLIDFRMLASKEALIFGGVYTLVASVAKVAGCGIPVMFCGFNFLGGMRIGFGMLPRCEIALTIAGIGLAEGVVSQEVVGVSVFLMVGTTLIAPPALIALFKREGRGTRHAAGHEGGQEVSFNFPSRQVTELLVDDIRAIFTAEGFFTHLLDKMSHLYQFRKDDIVIGLRRNATEIIFSTCSKEDIPLVNTAMYEATVDLEQMITELQKPLDDRAIVRRVQDERPEAGRRIDLAAHLNPRTLEPNLQAGTKEQVIDELLGILEREGFVDDLALVRAAIWSREKSLSTGMQHGIAIPHAKTRGVKQLVCAIGLNREGVDFESLDGEPATIFILVLCPEETVSPYVQFISTVSQILDEEGRKNLLACARPRQMMAVLRGARIVAEHEPAPQRPEAVRRAGAAAEEHLAPYIRPDRIKINLAGRTKNEILDELLDLLVATGEVTDVAEARRVLLEREKAMPTGMEHGLAIPHARTDTVERLVCVVGTSPDGVAFGSLDGEPSTIFVLTLSPASNPGPQMQIMAMIGRALDAEGRKGLLAARTAEEACDVLVRGSGQKS